MIYNKFFAYEMIFISVTQYQVEIFRMKITTLSVRLITWQNAFHILTFWPLLHISINKNFIFCSRHFGWTQSVSEKHFIAMTTVIEKQTHYSRIMIHYILRRNVWCK